MYTYVRNLNVISVRTTVRPPQVIFERISTPHRVTLTVTSNACTYMYNMYLQAGKNVCFVSRYKRVLYFIKFKIPNFLANLRVYR